MRIKKKNRNEYALASDVWVRNLCKEKVPYLDLNKLSSDNDYKTYLTNEFKNKTSQRRTLSIEDPTVAHKNVAIVSDGFDFANKQELLVDLPYKKASIFAVNGALAKWELVGNVEKKRAISFYVLNNPYHCSHLLPKKHNYFPNCIASTRSNFEFIESYKGEVSFYLPVPDGTYNSSMKDTRPAIDDYRNPICAAMNLAYHFGVKKILLFCCDDSFAEERPGAEELKNGLWQYPQQQISHNIIDANAYWLKQEGIEIYDHSSGANYENITYIKEETIKTFYVDEDKND